MPFNDPNNKKKTVLPDDLHNHQKKIAVINDLTGFGRCSVAVSLPIISEMGIQCCFLPTAVLSNQTGFDSYYLYDFTDHFEAYAREWEKLKLRFNGIATGFLGSMQQADLTASFIRRFRDKTTFVLVDPVMGDNGKRYPVFSDQHCEKIRELVALSDLTTPNLTEACILTGTDFHDGFWSEDELFSLAEKTASLGPSKVVISGIPDGDFVTNYIYDEGETGRDRKPRLGGSRNGTGDIFASILIADAVNDRPLKESVQKASSFIQKCIKRSLELNIPPEDGVAFEEELKNLH
ncbi:MAG: pyridoxamine kinase [Lachnospiraceae bacterium]|nr:pyridoxamine kinase [Lachnospiraceae bacterium]